MLEIGFWGTKLSPPDLGLCALGAAALAALAAAAAAAAKALR